MRRPLGGWPWTLKRFHALPINTRLIKVKLIGWWMFWKIMILHDFTPLTPDVSLPNPSWSLSFPMVGQSSSTDAIWTMWEGTAGLGQWTQGPMVGFLFACPGLFSFLCTTNSPASGPPSFFVRYPDSFAGIGSRENLHFIGLRVGLHVFSPIN